MTLGVSAQRKHCCMLHAVRFFPIQLYKCRGRNRIAAEGLRLMGSLSAKSYYNCGPSLGEEQGVGRPDNYHRIQE